MNSQITATTSWECDILSTILNTIKDNKIYVEIGGLFGQSLRFMSKFIEPKGMMVTIDNIKQKNAEQIKNVVKELNKTYDVHFINQDSKDPKTIDKLKQILNNKLIDILLIDGDHSLYGVVQDTHNYTPLVKPNGLIIFHDCGRLNGAQHGRRHMAEVGSAFRAFAWEKPYILLQEYAGIGIVWNRQMEVIDRYKGTNTWH